MTEILSINPYEPEAELIARAVDFLKRGKVVSYPTETFYGLGVDITDEKAIKRLYDIKRRDWGLPVAILVSDMQMLETIVEHIPDPARNLIKNFWPGALTMLFPAGPNVSKTLTTNTGKIGVRISSHPIATALVMGLGRPVTTTSANLSGFPPSLNIRHVQKYFRSKIDCIIDGGECEPSRGSTVVDVSDETMAIIRDGAIPAEKVIKCFQEG